MVVIDGWLKLTAPAQTAVLCKELRSALHSILKEMIRKPEVWLHVIICTLVVLFFGCLGFEAKTVEE